LEHAEHSSHQDQPDDSGGKLKLATSATLHCLLGCGIGEVVGLVIGIALLLSNVATIVLAVTLGFVFGLGSIPLLKAEFLLKDAIRQVLITEGLSIAVMETAEVLVEVYTPGVMGAGLAGWMFWGGMLLTLTAGFLAAFPVNYVLVGAWYSAYSLRLTKSPGAMASVSVEQTNLNYS